MVRIFVHILGVLDIMFFFKRRPQNIVKYFDKVYKLIKWRHFLKTELYECTVLDVLKYVLTYFVFLRKWQLRRNSKFFTGTFLRLDICNFDSSVIGRKFLLPSSPCQIFAKKNCQEFNVHSYDRLQFFHWIDKILYFFFTMMPIKFHRSQLVIWVSCKTH